MFTRGGEVSKWFRQLTADSIHSWAFWRMEKKGHFYYWSELNAIKKKSSEAIDDFIK